MTCEHGVVGYCETCALRDPGEYLPIMRSQEYANCSCGQRDRIIPLLALAHLQTCSRCNKPLPIQARIEVVHDMPAELELTQDEVRVLQALVRQKLSDYKFYSFPSPPMTEAQRDQLQTLLNKLLAPYGELS